MSSGYRDTTHRMPFGTRDASAVQSTPTVAVALDGSAQAMVALPVARGLAEIEGAPLHVVHVCERALPPRETLEELGLTAEELRGSVIDQLTGTPATGILRVVRERQSKLIVMCTHTGHPGAGGELGPVAEEVLLGASCPVVLVRPERGPRPWSLRRIVLPYDGTPTAAPAIGPAADLARRADAELVALHVAAPRTPLPAESGTFATPRYVDQPQHEWPAWSDEFLEHLRDLGHSHEAVRLCVSLAHGEPSEEIVRFADRYGSDLIVFAWHGMLGTKHARTIKAVIHTASCPVLVIRVARPRLPARSTP